MADQEADRNARHLRRRASRSIEELKGTSLRLANEVRAARSEVDRIEADNRLTAEAKAADRRAVEERLRESVDGAERRIRDTSAKVEKLLDAATRPDEGDPTVALVRESRLGRAWRRAERLIDAGEDPIVIAQQAVESGDRDTVAALREELPAYLKAQGRGAQVNGAMLEIDAATASLASPVERAARGLRQEAERSRRRAETAISWVRVDGVESTEVPGPDGLLHVDG